MAGGRTAREAGKEIHELLCKKRRVSSVLVERKKLGAIDEPHLERAVSELDRQYDISLRGLRAIIWHSEFHL